MAQLLSPSCIRNKQPQPGFGVSVLREQHMRNGQGSEWRGLEKGIFLGLDRPAL